MAPPLILVVDDFVDALTMYQEYLTFMGYHVIVATNGAEAIAMTHAHRPRLILMDLQMPRMSGTEAMCILRADRAFDEVPIVAFTAHALEEEQRAAMLAGFDEVIAKPCLLDEFIADVDRLLATPRVQPS